MKITTLSAVLLMSLNGSVKAEEGSITIDQPIACTTIAGVGHALYVYQQHREMDVAVDWAEQAAECVVLESMDVPSNLSDGFILLFQDRQMKYGYLPLFTAEGVPYYLFFLQIRGRGTYT